MAYKGTSFLEQLQRKKIIICFDMMIKTETYGYRVGSAVLHPLPLF